MFTILATNYAPVDPLTPPCEISLIPIGYKGENKARCLVFDLTECVEQFGAGNFEISFIRQGDAQPYLVTDTDQLDNNAIWEINSTDTAVEGYGLVQLMYFVDGVVCKTAQYRTVTFDSNESAGDVPDPYTNLLDQIAAYAAQAQAGAVSAASSAASAKDYADHIADPVAGLVTDWLEENITQETGYVLDDSLTVEDAAADAKAVGDALKVTQENLTAGNALQLASNNYTEDSVPYVFRQTGGGVEVGNREFDSLVGGTIAWNQLCVDGNFTDATKWDGRYSTVSVSGNVVTVTPSSSGTARGLIEAPSTGIKAIINHKYFLQIDVKSPITSTVKISIGGGYAFSVAVTADTWVTARGLWTTSENASKLYALINDSVTTSQTIQYRKANVFDLTQMFGTAVADYIYSLEQATAGAGVAYFRAMFPESYYAYNAGELKHVTGVSAHVTTGFNQWDEEWQNGRWAGNNGVFNPAFNTFVASKNLIPVVPNTTYYFFVNSSVSTSREYVYYDASGQWLSDGASAYTNGTFTTPTNCYFMAFNLGGGYGTAYKNDICINISDPVKNGTYEPYEKHTYALDASLTIRGVPKLVDNKLTYDGDTYESDGTVTRWYAVITITGSTISNHGTASSGVKYVSGSLSSFGRDNANAISTKYPPVTSPSQSGTTGIRVVGTTFYIYDDAFTDLDTAKGILNSSPVTYVYNLATPTTETADPYQSPQICANGGTEQYVVTEQSGVAVPVGHVTKYPTDQVAKLDGLPSNFSTLIAPVEQVFKATRNYTVGSYLIVNNQLYKVTSAIANGGTITPNTNVTATTIMAEILSL